MLFIFKIKILSISNIGEPFRKLQHFEFSKNYLPFSNLWDLKKIAKINNLISFIITINNLIAKILKIDNLTQDELPESKELKWRGFFLLVTFMMRCTPVFMKVNVLIWTLLKKMIGSCQLQQSVIWTLIQWENKSLRINLSSHPRKSNECSLITRVVMFLIVSFKIPYINSFQIYIFTIFVCTNEHAT